MSAIRSQSEEMEKLPAKLCRCGRQPELVRTMLSVQTGRQVRMFECRCGERTWDD
ncbi:CDGSH-type Zn-finger protein [Bradyrhizobium embrapense]